MNLLPLIWVCLAVGVALLPAESGRRLGGAGLVPIGLGLAAWQVSWTSGAGAGMPAGFVAVNAGLMLLGATVVAAAVVRSRRRPDVPELPEEPAQEPEHRPARPPAPARALLAGYAAGTVAAVAGPHLALMFAGLALAAWCDWGLRRVAADGERWPVGPALATVLLLVCYWFLATVAGPEGLRVSAVALLPLSPAAERLVALALLFLLWLLLRLWPFPTGGLGGLTGPLALVLLIRVGLPAAAAGLEHWQPLAFPAALIGVWAGAITRRLPTLARAGAMLGLASLDRRAIFGSALLLLAALGLEWLDRTAGMRQGRRRIVLYVAIAAGAAWGGLAVTAGGLRAEVVYTVLAAGGVALAFMRRPPRRAAGGAPPRT